MGAESRLLELGITLGARVHPVANYQGAVASGQLLFVSGHGPVRSNGTLVQGKVGDILSFEQAHDAARLVGMSLLATVRAQLGSLDRVSRIVKVLGMVNCAPGFIRMPEVIDGCSDLLVEVFGIERGRHARSAIGVAELPFDIPVEVEMICEFE
ncbi:MAG: RidA family protein [Acidimicrobiales bacterium]